MPELADLWDYAETVPLDSSDATITLVSAEAGTRPVVLHFWALAGTATTVLFDSWDGSAATNLTGAMAVGTTTPLVLQNDGVPVIIARNLGDSLRITNSGPQALDGFAVVARLPSEVST